MSELKFATPGRYFEEVVAHGFDEAEEGEGFEYIVGKIKGGELKVVFEPAESHDSVVIDGVDGFGYCLVFEDNPANE